MCEVLVVGSVNLDLSARVARLPLPGETISGATLERFPGGKGANQALAARRLGARVRLLAAVGEDGNAGEALALLDQGGVDLGLLQRFAEAPTGLAMIAVTPGGENQIVVAPGANAELRSPDAGFPQADLAISQLETPAAVLVDLVESFAGFICVNLAPAKEIDVSVLQRADLIVVNESEASWYGQSLSAARGLVATTFGADGARLVRGDTLLAETRPPAVEVVDTTGAGDTFTAALALKLAEGWAAPAALEFACTAGALATTRRGAQPSLPTEVDVAALLAV
ncbi:MAG: ribokinase [Pseudomonadota bacterium]